MTGQYSNTPNLRWRELLSSTIAQWFSTGTAPARLLEISDQTGRALSPGKVAALFFQCQSVRPVWSLIFTHFRRRENGVRVVQDQSV